MEDDKWENLVLDVEEYLDSGAIDGPLKKVIELNLDVGKENPTERVAASNALKALLRGRDGTPFKQGGSSGLPAKVRISIDAICKELEEKSIEYFNSMAFAKFILLKHGRSGGGQYASAEEYAEVVSKKARKILSGMFKDNSWDGLTTSLV